MKKLSVHIGANKTGSSAIQHFLKENANSLKEQGVLIPDSRNLSSEPPIEGHHIWFFQDLRGDNPESTALVSEKIDLLMSEPRTKQVLISAENLGNNTSEYHRLFAEPAKKYDMEIIIYIRRQDEFLISSWQQWHAKVHTDFWSWLISNIGTLGNWKTILENWSSIVEREQIKVNIYEPHRFNGGDIVTDFSQYILAESSELTSARSNLVNPSFNRAVMDLVADGGFFDDGHDHNFYKFLNDILGQKVHKRADDSMITHEQRLAILRRYASINSWVRAKYFATADVPASLFKMPNPNESRVRPQEELFKEQIRLLARLVFELSKKRDRD